MWQRTSTLLLILFLAAGLAVKPARAQDRGYSPINPLPATPTDEARQALDAVLLDYDVVQLPLRAIANRARSQGLVEIVLRGQRHELLLTPSDPFAEEYRAFLMTDSGPVQVPRPRPETYQGRLAADPESVVSLTVTGQFLTAAIRSGGEELFVDPLRDFVAGAPKQLAVVYRAADVRPDAAGDCGTVSGLRRLRATSIGDLLRDPALLKPLAHDTLRRLDVATDADGEYFQLYGNPGTFNRIAAIINSADSAYQNDLNLTLNISFQQAWVNPANDPYVSTDSLVILRDEFRVWWNANRGSVDRDAAHLFSGKDFDGSIIGRAFLSTVCANPSFSYGINQDFGSSFIRAELFAHELGHNLSALHDNQIPCPGVSCNGFGPIMCSFIQSNGSFTFSTCSQNDIDTFTHNNGSCLN